MIFEHFWKRSHENRAEIFVHFWFSFQFCRASGWRGANTPGGGLWPGIFSRGFESPSPQVSNRSRFEMYIRIVCTLTDTIKNARWPGPKDSRVAGVFLQVRFTWSFFSTFEFLRYYLLNIMQLKQKLFLRVEKSFLVILRKMARSILG